MLGPLTRRSRAFAARHSVLRLAPNDALDGYIDVEVLRDDIQGRGESEFVVGWRPYVEVAGYGRAFTEVEPDPNG